MISNMQEIGNLSNESSQEAIVLNTSILCYQQLFFFFLHDRQTQGMYKNQISRAALRHDELHALAQNGSESTA